MSNNLIEIAIENAPDGTWGDVCYEVKRFKRETKADEICFERRDYEDFCMVAYKIEVNNE